MGKLLSFDPKKYSPWQRRTFYCCAFMFVLSVVLATVGVVFVAVSYTHLTLPTTERV